MAHFVSVIYMFWFNLLVKPIYIELGNSRGNASNFLKRLRRHIVLGLSVHEIVLISRLALEGIVEIISKIMALVKETAPHLWTNIWLGAQCFSNTISSFTMSCTTLDVI